MVAQPQPASKQASREASEWFVFLQDDPSDLALRRRFDEWLDASPENALAWSDTLRASSLAESLLPFDARDWTDVGIRKEPAIGRGGSHSVSVPSKSLSKRRWLLPVVVSAATAGLVFLFAPTLILRLQSDYVTGTGQVQDVVLEDGSTVTLAPGSAIAVSFASTERQVRLLSGEAFFAVKPNAERPFHVVAGNVRASVLGTSFDVQLEKSGVELSVEEGRVRVESANVTEVLGAGQSIHLGSRSDAAHRTSQPPGMIGAWRKGQLALEDRPLGAAVEHLGRYFDGTIILADASLRDRPVTGIFDLRDPEGALRAMAKALGVKVQKVTPWVLIVSGS
jgi:transmembrane sensor